MREFGPLRVVPWEGRSDHGTVGWFAGLWVRGWSLGRFGFVHRSYAPMSRCSDGPFWGDWTLQGLIPHYLPIEEGGFFKCQTSIGATKALGLP